MANRSDFVMWSRRLAANFIQLQDAYRSLADEPNYTNADAPEAKRAVWAVLTSSA